MSVADSVRARGARRARGVGLLVSVALSGQAYADPASVVYELRMTGCEGVAAVLSAARRSGALDAAARELARDERLDDALARAGYPAASATSFHVRGSHDDAAIRGALAARHCRAVNDPELEELGVHQSGDETWIVMAARAEMPFAALQDPAAVAERVLELVNAARAVSRRCGEDDHPAAPPLTMSTALTAAASVHSLDMAEHGEPSHEGSDGSSSADRIARTGYDWQAWGENVAAGQGSAEAVVDAWHESPGHCATLMEARFTETGVAYALAPGKNPAVYWTQVFAEPR